MKRTSPPLKKASVAPASARSSRRERARRRRETRRVPDDPTTPFVPTLAHWRYLRAHLDLLDERQVLSVVNLAKRIGISRIAIWKMHKRHPRLRAWVNQQLHDAAREHGGAVLMKMAHIGLQGSEPHARLFFTVTGQVGPVKVTPGGNDDRQPTRVIYEYPAGTPATP